MILKVKLWGQEVGRLFWDGRNGVSVWAFNERFLKSGLDIAPFYAPVGLPSSRRPMNGIKEKPFGGLPPFIADSLPDAWGNLVFSTMMPELDRERNPLLRLSYIGKRGIGALEFEPETGRARENERVDLVALKELAARIQKERENVSFTEKDGVTAEQLKRLGSPPGGRQPKTLIAMDGNHNFRSGQAPAPHGFRYYVLKFQPQDLPCASLIEMTYNELMNAAGIDAATARVINTGAEHHFLSERFDRGPGGEKYFSQTLAALYPDAKSYEDLMYVARRLGLGEDVSREIFARTTFNFLGCNTDDHYKNHSFIMDRDGRWRLAPAYDVTYTISPSEPLSAQSHCLSVKGKVRDVTVDDLLAFAQEEQVKSAEKILARVCEALTGLRKKAQFYRVPPEWIDRMEENVSKNLPEEYARRMEGYKGLPLEPYSDGDLSVSDVRFEETISHDVKLLATINGREFKYVFRNGRAVADEIGRKGMNRMSPEEKKEMVGKYLLPKAREFFSEGRGERQAEDVSKHPPMTPKL